MTNKDFIARLENIAKMKTYYIKGGFGHVLKASNKKRLIDQYSANKAKEAKINSFGPCIAISPAFAVTHSPAIMIGFVVH